MKPPSRAEPSVTAFQLAAFAGTVVIASISGAPQTFWFYLLNFVEPLRKGPLPTAIKAPFILTTAAALLSTGYAFYQSHAAYESNKMVLAQRILAGSPDRNLDYTYPSLAQKGWYKHVPAQGSVEAKKVCSTPDGQQTVIATRPAGSNTLPLYQAFDRQALSDGTTLWVPASAIRSDCLTP